MDSNLTELEDDGVESVAPARASVQPTGGDVEGFAEDFSQMLRSHFREKSKIKKTITNGHIVTFSFVISVSTPLSADRLVELEAKAAKKKNQGGIQGPVDPSIAIAHMHLEYSILPGDTPLKTDVVFYATAARVFPDRHDPKTVRTWWADGQLWCSWTHSHSVHVTDALLRKIANHAIELKIWDSRDKLSQKARTDRPRGFRASDLEGAPPSGMGLSVTSMLGIAGGVVVTQAKLYSQEQSRQVLLGRPFAQTIRKHAQAGQHKSLEGTTPGHGATTTGRTSSPTPTESKSSDTQGAKVVPEAGQQLRDYSLLARAANSSADFEEMNRRKRLNIAYRHGMNANKAMLHQGSIPNERRDGVSSVASKQTGGGSMSKRIRPSPNGETPSKSDVALTNDPSKLSVAGLDPGIRSSMASVTTMTGGNVLPNNAPVSSSVMQSVRLRLATLYDGRKSTTCRIQQPLGLVSDCLITLIVDPSLLSESQMIRFKPVMLRIVSGGPLPPGYVAGNAVYCKCLMPDLSPTPADAATNSDPKAGHSRAVDELMNKDKIAQQQQAEAELTSTSELVQPFNNHSAYWNHSIVLLTGDMPDEALRLSLLQRPLILELHDREIPTSAAGNPSTTASNATLNSTASTNLIKPAVFGTLPNDNQLASTAVLPPPPPEPPKPPFGLAEVSLYDLLVSATGKGISFSKSTVIVKPMRPAPAKNSAESTVKKLPLPKYLENGTVIKLTARAPIPLFSDVKLKSAAFESAAPIMTSRKSPAPPPPKSAPATPEPTLNAEQCISTMVIVIPAQLNKIENVQYPINSVIENMIKTVAIDTNSETLSLSGLATAEERAAALTAYQLSPTQQIDKNLNLVTGFHLIDEDGVVFAVEGFNQVIGQLWENIMAQVLDFESANRKMDARVSVFYNSSLSSPVRRYGGIDLSLGVMALGRGISKIVSEPLLYVRDMAPAQCRGAVVKLAELRSSASSLADILRRSLLPSASELRSLYDEFAIKTPVQPSEQLKREFSSDSPVDMPSSDYEKAQEGENEIHEYRIRDFKRENTEAVWHVSEKNRMRREQTETISVAVNTGHVYSSHSVNAVEIAKAHIRNHMLLPNRRYTFSQEYLHRTMEPRAPSPEKLAIYPHARHWQYPGFISAVQANQNSRMPDKARLEELAEPWRENWLHEKYLKPPLIERDPLPWELRNADLKLFSAPDREKPLPSVFSAGDATTIPLECLSPKPDRRFRTYRRGVRSELELYSSKLSILDRVADVLHDEPSKIALRYKNVRDIPKISTLAHDPPNKDDKCVAFGPVEYNDWLLNRNIIALKSTAF